MSDECRDRLERVRPRESNRDWPALRQQWEQQHGTDMYVQYLTHLLLALKVAQCEYAWVAGERAVFPFTGYWLVAYLDCGIDREMRTEYLPEMANDDYMKREFATQHVSGPLIQVIEKDPAFVEAILGVDPDDPDSLFRIDLRTV